MDLPNFHDGYFDGFRVGSNKTVTIFLRTCNQKIYELVLHGVKRLAISGAKEGNIILDLVVRSAREATHDDLRELFDLDQTPEQAERLLESTREGQLQILELNPSYGAQGLFLFESYILRTVSDS
jgi:hypothetical protein